MPEESIRSRTAAPSPMPAGRARTPARPPARLHRPRTGIAAALPVALLVATLLSPAVGCNLVQQLTDPETVAERTITLQASPTSLPEGGGTVELTATVKLGGEPEAGVRVTFEASGGTFDPANTAVTDGGGNARTKLHVTGPVTVSAKVEAGSVAVATSASVQIRTGEQSSQTAGDLVFELNVTPSPTRVAEPVTIAIKITRAADGQLMTGDLDVDFGDGEQQRFEGYGGDGEVAHTYADPGNFTLKVSFTATGGETGSAELQIDVQEGDRTLEIAAAASEVPAREAAAFTVTVRRDNGKLGTGKVRIDWGDGRNTNLGSIDGKATTEHVFRDPGSYKIVAELTDSDKTVRASVRVRVTEAIQLTASLTPDDPSPEIDQGVTFTLTVRRNDGRAVNGTADVDFGDGASARVSVDRGRASTTHTYTAAGTYTVAADVTDDAGRSASASLQLTVSEAGGGGGGGCGGGGADALDPNSVVWLHANVANWTVSSTTTSVTVSPQQICIDHTKAGQWQVKNNVEGNPWVIANVGGTWYAGTYEWLRSGQICKALGVPSEHPDTARALGPHIKKSPLDTWVPKAGEVVYFFVSTHARDATRTSNERSNIVKVIWPY